MQILEPDWDRLFFLYSKCISDIVDYNQIIYDEILNAMSYIQCQWFIVVCYTGFVYIGLISFLKHWCCQT